MGSCGVGGATEEVVNSALPRKDIQVCRPLKAIIAITRLFMLVLDDIDGTKTSKQTSSLFVFF